MKRAKVLLLGAGRVSGPTAMVLRREGHELTIADAQLAAAEGLADAARGERALELSLSLDDEVAGPKEWFDDADAVISLLPPPFHSQVARACLRSRVPLVTASYVDDATKALHDEAREAGITVLTEMGLDPGIDHVSARMLLDRARRDGQAVRRFTSHCGALPARKHADNFLGYKFSWSPAGVVSAACSGARWVENGEVVEIPPEELFARVEPLDFPGFDAAMEWYPNRNSVPYLEKYEATDVKGIVRGTIRYRGWGVFWHALRRLGWLSDATTSPLPPSTREDIATALGEAPTAELVDRLCVLLEPAPREDDRPPVELLTELLTTRDDLQLRPGEEDLVLMVNRIEHESDGPRQGREATLLLRSQAGSGHTAVALTTGGMAGLGALLVLGDQFRGMGVVGPHHLELARAIEPLLETIDVEMVERDWSE
ncbi:MAG: saccharopine dehydrogenase C-terminal domain-containing protein [Acidobacteriota bacterium]